MRVSSIYRIIGTLVMFTTFSITMSTDLPATTGITIDHLLLNSSIHSLRVLDQKKCSPYHDPPKPQCLQAKVSNATRIPVFLVTWKLDSETSHRMGYCYKAVNITYTCNNVLGFWSLSGVIAANSVKWPWIDNPTIRDLENYSNQGFIGDKPIPECSMFRIVNSSFIKGFVERCSIPTTSAGIVSDPNYPDCDLGKQANCSSLSGLIHFVASGPPPEYKSCPVSLDKMDIGILEAGQSISKESPVTLSATKTKRLFYWTNDTTAGSAACLNLAFNLPIFIDEGGFFISMETLSAKEISPLQATSKDFVALLGESTTYTPNQLDVMFKSYSKKLRAITTRVTREKRTLDFLLSPLQGYIRSMEIRSNKQVRPKRDVSRLEKSFSYSISDLQRSYIRAEVQHDFSEMASWLNDQFQSLYKSICDSKLKGWWADTLSNQPPSQMMKYISGDPHSILISDKNNHDHICTPLIPPTDTLFKLMLPPKWISGSLLVKDMENKSWALHPHTGILSPLGLIPTDTNKFTSFMIPFKSGCSLDILQMSTHCPEGYVPSDINLVRFLHSTGPMYKLNELAGMLKGPEQTIYQSPGISPVSSNTIFDSQFLGDTIWGWFEPFTKIWSLLSPNMWSAIYSILILVILIKLFIIISHWLHRRHMKKLEERIESGSKDHGENYDAGPNSKPLIFSEI